MPTDTPVQGTTPSPPNIVWIIADDIGYDLQAYGNTLARTPNLNKLARNGTTFWRFYTPAPVCSPSRVGFSTGMHPAELGVYTSLHADESSNGEYNGSPGIPAYVPTIFELLAAHGYHTAHAGKWHKGSAPGYGPLSKQVEEFFSYAIPGGSAPELAELFREGPTPYYRHVDDRLTDWSVDYIQRTEGPFLLELSYHTPHNPLYPDAHHLQELSHLAGFQAPGHVGLEPPPVTPAQVYYGAIKQLDDNIGRIQSALRARGIADNTIVLFMGDNGPGTTRLANTSFNAYGSTGPFRGTKATVYEAGIRVPMMATGPGIAAGAEIQAALSGTDIVPSLLSMLQMKTTARFYGEDMSHLFRGDDRQRQKALHWITIQRRPHSESIANRSPVLAMYEPATDIKCLMQPDGSRKEAYRTALDDDPAELNNLHLIEPGVADRCFTALAQWYDELPPPRRFYDGAGTQYPDD